MWTPEVEAGWRALTDEVLAGMAAWRAQHPRASLAEIEAALDGRLARVRARLLEDLALASPAADVQAAAREARPRCAACGAGLEPRGQETRQLHTQGGQRLRLRRSRAVCPTCGVGVFPPG